ncbi:aminoacetone oxidase family FAD-binding enzyme [Fluviispira vulneris]|uniref:aminoacetone oxidase family FAD-binding enzyme n=1 Tax=Fluviispira vulneris TaxID=2763012 RepID=UPI001C9443F5|nr:aminoacetone oxidase family FAD-binding enzyme [Fluviispira vulneris]
MPYGVSLAGKMGHKLVTPVPSLFTFQIKNPLLKDLAGISFSEVTATLKMEGSAQDFIQKGPCLITHWGLSGPAILKLSAFAARELHASGYKATLIMNWTQSLKPHDALALLEVCKTHSPKKKLSNENPFPCVKRFWDAILRESGLNDDLTYGDVTKKQLQEIAQRMTQYELNVKGKGEFKDEFVTAGGVAREEIDFRTMESKIHPGLYFAGEATDVDGVTGGFNFQNAWTGAWLCGQDVAKKLGQ